MQLLEQIAIAQRERSKTLKEMAANSGFFFRPPAAYDEKAVRKHVTPVCCRCCAHCSGSSAAAPVDREQHPRDARGGAAGNGLSLGKMAQPLRLAMCGGTVSPPIDATLEILGRDEVAARLEAALSLWNG